MTYCARREQTYVCPCTWEREKGGLGFRLVDNTAETGVVADPECICDIQ